MNKAIKLLHSETKFKHRSNKKIPHYLLNGKINPLPRIPGSIGDSANKTEESSSQVPVLLREGIWIGGPSRLHEGLRGGSGDNAALPLLEYWGSQLLYYK